MCLVRRQRHSQQSIDELNDRGDEDAEDDNERKGSGTEEKKKDISSLPAHSCRSENSLLMAITHRLAL
jgi:hypothetical protein